MIVYLKSLSSDFSGNFNPDRFYVEVMASNISNVSSSYLGTTMKDGEIEIIFNSELSSEDLIILNNIISNHQYSMPVIMKNKYISVYPSNLKKQKKTAYTVVTNFNYRGSDAIGSINYIEAISHMDSTVTNYKIRVVDKNTGNILVEKTGLNNTTPELFDLGTITNVPSVNSMLEIHVYKNSTKDTDFVYIDEILIYYGN